MRMIFYLICMGLGGYCGLYSAYCFIKGRKGEGISAAVLTIICGAAVAFTMAAV